MEVYMPETHRHKCYKCGREWEHENQIPGSPQTRTPEYYSSHICCGEAHRPWYYGPGSNGWPADGSSPLVQLGSTYEGGPMWIYKWIDHSS